MNTLVITFFGILLPLSALFWILSSDSKKIERGEFGENKSATETSGLIRDMYRATASVTITQVAIIVLRLFAYLVLVWSLIAASRLSTHQGIWAFGTVISGVIGWAMLIGFAEIVTCLQDMREMMRKGKAID